MGVTTNIIELRRLRKKDVEQKKPRTLLVILPNEHEARLTLARIHEHREQLKQKGMFILPALSKENDLKNNPALNRRKTLLDQKVPAEKLKIRILDLFNEGRKVETSTEGAKSA